MQIKISKTGFTIFAVLVLLIIGVVTVKQTQIKQIFYGNADTVTALWDCTDSATTECNSSGQAVINVSFTNTETDSTQIMIVTATDQQTNKSVNLGTIKPGQTVTGTIETGQTSLKAGEVVFTMVWSYDTSESDTRTADYSAVGPCAAPTPSVTPTSKYTPTPTYNVSPTTVVSPAPSASPTVCPTPGTVTNINIQCPYCTPSPTSSS